MDTSEWTLPTIFHDLARQLRFKAEMNHFFNTNQPELDAFADSFRPKPKWTISSIETKKELNGVSSWSHDLKPTIILASPPTHPPDPGSCQVGGVLCPTGQIYIIQFCSKAASGASRACKIIKNTRERPLGGVHWSRHFKTEMR